MIISKEDGYIKEEIWKLISIVFDSETEKNEVLKNIINFGMGLKMILRP